MLTKNLGISGRIANAFLKTQITPLLALTGLLLGIFAVLITPKEEEPQINVTFANVFIPFPGASPEEVEALVTNPAEHIVAEIQGVEHIYSTSSPGMASLVVRFTVGESRTDAILRLYNAFYAKGDWLPTNLGVGRPLIKPKGIDDVPIVSITLWSKDTLSNTDLLAVARRLQTDLQRVPGTREINIIGGSDKIVKVNFDPQRLAAYHLSLEDLRNTLSAANSSMAAGSLVSNNTEMLVEAGGFLINPEEVADLVVGIHLGAPVFLRDVADVNLQENQPQHYVTHGLANTHEQQRHPAVTLTVGKKAGENAVQVAADTIARIDALRGIDIPDAIEISVTRDYGKTAQDKASTLIKKLIFATLSVIILVLLALGKREAMVVGAAVIVTLAITLFASWAWGFTLNRVSLFALIFSIGILVDDAIVVVENIHRHITQNKMPLDEAIPLAVDEVGGPTILATFTVIAALLPMAFVSGLMGPYMLPIPINASSGMLISLAVAFMFTPWLYRKLFLRASHTAPLKESQQEQEQPTKFLPFFTKIMTPFLRQKKGKRARLLLLGGIFSLIFMSLGLVAIQAVMLKMLPFDNKSEFQIVIDLPEGTALERTDQVLQALANKLDTVPEVTDYQLYSGTAAPINFNGLVRQNYLRKEPFMGEIQVNLTDKNQRNRKSHAIALDVRALLAPVASEFNANVKVVEVPPGPPVLSPIVAEIYGMDYTRQLAIAKEVRHIFETTADVVDVDDSINAAQIKWQVLVDRARAARFGVDQAEIARVINTALQGEDVSYLHSAHAKTAIPIRLSLAAGEKDSLEKIQDLQVRSRIGELVAITEVTTIVKNQLAQTIHHKDLLPVVYVTGDVAGTTDSPLYGLAAIYQQLETTPVAGQIMQQFLNSQPENPYQWSLKWDGELQVTLDTFRDMAIAYSVGLIIIYLLVVSMFKSYSVPLIIMAPIPLTIIGILPGHALLGQQFSAPSMIGMIALAGIIVRNSILLVDFIQQEIRHGKSLQEATINAAAVRALPIGLTALAAMMGGFFIIDDPIFGGLAVSLIFGLMVSTLLTLLVIPVVYYAYHYQQEREV